MSGLRPSKRRRIYRACDQCRRRKSKCDGEQPRCSICSSAGRTCSYETGGGRRGLAPGYVRGLEIILGLVFQHSPDSEASIHSILCNSRGSNFLESKPAKNAHNVWRKSKLSKNLNQLLSPSDDLNELDWEPTEDHDQDRDERMDDQPSPQAYETTVPQELQTPSVRLLQSSRPFDAQVPENTPNLLNFYFTYTHCWFPILERRELLRAMHLGPGLSPLGASSSQLLLWSVIVYSSVMGDINISGLPSPSEIQIGIQQQALASWDSLDLAHIQATLILSLIHIATGNFSLAWNIVGQATRMLMTLPPSAKKNRFTHTFNGCVFLDNILSATLGKTPGLSQQEQLDQGPVDSDDVDEWDTWTAIPRANTNNNGRKAPTPLRALSTSNAIRKLMADFSERLYHQHDLPSINEFIKSNQHYMQNHPYQRQQEACPPLLILHLTSAFTTLTLVRKNEQVSPTIIELCIRTVYHMLDLLDHYHEIMGEIRPSPLVSCFAFQCQQCITFTSGALSNIEKENMERRINRFSQPIQPINLQIGSRPFARPSTTTPTTQGNVFNAGGAQSVINDPINIPAQSYTSAMEISVVPPSQDNIPDGIEGYDALFEEMVTSFPTSREEPVFAHNLGFYDGDLDTDFLAHLQCPPAS